MEATPSADVDHRVVERPTLPTTETLFGLTRQRFRKHQLNGGNVSRLDISPKYNCASIGIRKVKTIGRC